MEAEKSSSKAFATSDSKPISPREVTKKLESGPVTSLMSGLKSAANIIPLGFFQSRAEVRTWGEAEVADPSVQPRASDAPADFGTGLPGYPRPSTVYFDQKFGRVKGSTGFVPLFRGLNVSDQKLLGPKLAPGPFCEVQYPPLPPKSLGKPSYDYKGLRGYQMDHLPYVNAIMTPQDASRMYVSANWMVGYPYGVPAVEENEAAELASAAKASSGCCW